MSSSYFSIRLGDWQTCRADAQAVRTEVFIVEQSIPVELEWDEMDALCVHALAYDGAGRPIGTGRLLPDGHIGRMAVKIANRGDGVGAALLAALMQAARQRAQAAVMLNAQIQAEAFYARHGFVAQGEVFPDAGIPHIHMRYVFE